MSDTYIALANLACHAVLAVCAVVTVVHLIKKDRRRPACLLASGVNKPQQNRNASPPKCKIMGMEDKHSQQNRAAERRANIETGCKVAHALCKVVATALAVWLLI